MVDSATELPTSDARAQTLQRQHTSHVSEAQTAIATIRAAREMTVIKPTVLKIALIKIVTKATITVIINKQRKKERNLLFIDDYY
jgi:hypothetical protein